MIVLFTLINLIETEVLPTQAGFPRFLHKSNVGLGVFSSEDLEPNTLIDVCPQIPDLTKPCPLIDYKFADAVAMGMCSFYNHQKNPNLEYTQENIGNFNMKYLRTVRKVSKGEELTI